MSQARYFDYGETLTSDAYAFLLSQTFVPGVYQGLDVSSGSTPDEILIAPGTVLLDDGVAINENAQQTLRLGSISVGQYLVVVKHKLQPIVGGTPATFGVIPVDNLAAWTAGFSYYVIATITYGPPVGAPPQYQVSIANAQKIRARLIDILQSYASTSSSLSQSFVAPLLGQRGFQGSQGTIGVQGVPGAPGPAGSAQYGRLVADFHTANAGMYDLPGLTADVVAGHIYEIEAELMIQFFHGGDMDTILAVSGTAEAYAGIYHEFTQEQDYLGNFVPDLLLAQTVMSVNVNPASEQVVFGPNPVPPSPTSGKWRIRGLLRVFTSGTITIQAGRSIEYFPGYWNPIVLMDSYLRVEDTNLTWVPSP